ncbi:MAG: MBL fold metallo-hydrolase [Acidobacteria bacterium]|nr:MBL fold metallo-hydrolase [Acidobacteriota bacterium]
MKRIAVSVLMVRGSNPRQVLLVKRNSRLAFLGGYLAFPGGVLESEDEEISVKNLSRLEDSNELNYQPFVVAAARELFEETGIWLAQGARPPFRETLSQYRRRMLDGEISFADILQRNGSYIDAANFTPLCRITTPPYSSRRYDTWFLCCHTPEETAAEIWPGELDYGEFIAPAEALKRWRNGEALIAPPVVTLLQELASRDWNSFRFRIRQLAEGYQRGKLQRDYYSCGVLMAPLKTRTKPPATHTNFFAVGQEQLYLIDPAADDPPEQEKLWELFDELLAEGRVLKGVLLTHGHPDHIGAVEECQRRYGLPVYAHRLTAQSLPKICFQSYLDHNQDFDLGCSPDGGAPWKLHVYHLPGHAPGHVAFQETRYRALIVGDLISSLSSILIDPADGHLGTYLKSLEFLKSVADGLIYPGHGHPVTDGRSAVEQARQHRQEREEQLLAALSLQPQPIEPLLEKVYGDLHSSLKRWAERSLRSGLIKLMEEGHVEETAQGYRLVG